MHVVEAGLHRDNAMRIVRGVIIGIVLVLNGLAASYYVWNIREEARLRQAWHERVTALCAPRPRYRWPERAIKASLLGIGKKWKGER